MTCPNNVGELYPVGSSRCVALISFFAKTWMCHCDCRSQARFFNLILLIHNTLFSQRYQYVVHYSHNNTIIQNIIHSTISMYNTFSQKCMYISTYSLINIIRGVKNPYTHLWIQSLYYFLFNLDIFLDPPSHRTQTSSLQEETWVL